MCTFFLCAFIDCYVKCTLSEGNRECACVHMCVFFVILNSGFVYVHMRVFYVRIIFICVR